jgi:hypothetical protein
VAVNAEIVASREPAYLEMEKIVNAFAGTQM